ncbi:MAG: hypothetical protein ACI8S6_000942 [Myxococcota bacterium]
MRYRAVSTLEVSSPERWAQLMAGGLEATWLGEPLSETCRIIADERPLIEHLQQQALVRYARRPAALVAADQQALADAIAGLPVWVRRVLHSAQRHALDDIVVGLHAWDPEEDAASVRALHGAGLLRLRAPEEPVYIGRYLLTADLPPPPTVTYDMEEAVMAEEADDLSEPGPGLIPLLNDMAALAAAILQVQPRRTHAGPLTRVDARRLGRRLGVPALVDGGALSTLPRWSRAMRALEALSAVRVDPLERTLSVDLGLEGILAGETPEAVDRLVHRFVDREQHVLLPAVRAALAQAGPGCIDTIVFCDLLQEQHRGVMFPSWQRAGQETYPYLPGEPPLAYDDDGFDRIEARAIGRLLKRLDRLGLVRRAEGVFAATDDGRLWSGATAVRAQPLWIGSDLELIVPPEAVTPWERFQLERLSRCRARDVVNRYALDREGLSAWLVGHDLDEAIDLLRRRSPGVPPVVIETLRGWAEAAMQIVITRGVLLPLEP